MARDMRGGTPTHTGRDPYSEPKERMRRGGGSYDAGPGREGLPSAQMMDRPRADCGAFSRTGNRRGSYDAQQPRIQSADRRGT